MKALGMTQEELAGKMGITRGAVTHYLAGRRQPPLQQFQKIAAILKVSPAWLQFGVTTAKNHPAQAKKEKNSQKKLPILSWEDVTTFSHADQSVEEFIPNFYTDQSSWYGLRVNSDAMVSPQDQNKSFHIGDILVIDPSKTATHGQFVIALLPKAKEAVFKQYVLDGGICYLKPLNPQYPMLQMDESTHICGVVVGRLNFF